MEYTTQNFSGFISCILPKESWVAKWNGVDQRVPGVYAIQVSDEVSLIRTKIVGSEENENDVDNEADEEE